MTAPSESPENSTPPQTQPATEPTSLRRVALLIVLALILIFGASILMERKTPSSSQATVQAYVVPMAAEVTGRVTDVAVIDNAVVTAGDVLFRIDPQPYQLVVSEAEAKLERIGQSVGANTSAVDSAQARVVDARAKRENIREQAQRAMQLVERGVYARARYDEAKAALDSSEATVTGAEADLERARHELGPTGENNPQIREALASLEKARLDLVRTTIRAPASGVITNLQLSTGQFVAAGQAALTFIDAGTIWVAAAFKENSLENVRAGSAAELVFDVFPGRIFAAKVESVGWGVSSSSSTNAGLPTIRNDTGWVREPQRFSVRLVLTERPPPGVRYGSQVNAVIYTGNSPVLNALGAFWIRLVSVLTYVS